MARKKMITLENFRIAAEKVGYVRSDIARALRVSRPAITAFCNDNKKETDAILAHQMDYLNDLAVSGLRYHLSRKNMRAIDLQLTRKGGYIQKEEVEHSGNVTVNSIIEDVYNKRLSKKDGNSKD